MIQKQEKIGIIKRGWQSMVWNKNVLWDC